MNEDRTDGGSIRADGSVRKTVKIRPGFKREEDSERYNVNERVRARRERTQQRQLEEKATKPQMIQTKEENLLKGLELDVSNVTGELSKLSVNPGIKPTEKVAKSTLQLQSQSNSTTKEHTSSYSNRYNKFESANDFNEAKIERKGDGRVPEVGFNNSSRGGRKKKYTLADIEAMMKN